MSIIHQRPKALIAIVIYKAVQASLLAITSITLFMALKHHDNLYEYSEEYVLSGKREVVKWVLEKVLNISPKTLTFGGIATAIYATVNGVEALGLWYQQKWAKLLVLGLVGISIPLEIFELIKGVSIIKFVVFLLNVAVFWYLLSHEID